MTAILNSTDSEIIQTIRDTYCDSLYALCKHGLGMDGITAYTHGQTIDALEELEFRKEGCTKALIVLPRGSFKSSIGSVGFPIWRLIRDFNKRILIDSATYELSTQLVGSIKAHLESPKLTNIFGTFRTRDDWSSKSLTIAQRTKILATGSIVAGGVGSPKVGSHFDCIIHDDLNTDKNSATPELRAKIIQHFQMNYAILEPGGDLAVIATRYSADDAVGHILDKEIGDDLLPSFLRSNQK